MADEPDLLFPEREIPAIEPPTDAEAVVEAIGQTRREQR
jgi:hypothetical protein